jgi:membrane fusion protein, multidrug efflux system
MRRVTGSTPTARAAAPAWLALAAGLAGCGGSAQTAPEAKARAVPVHTAAVAVQDLEQTVVLNGTLRPRAQVLVVAEVGARLLRVAQDEGARVADGELLAVLDETDYRLAHDRARAALAVAEANRAHALAERERADNLLKTGGITDKDHLTAQVGLQVAEAALAQAKAETAIAAQQQSRAQLRAPFAGRVAKRHVDRGAMLAVGTPVFTVVDDAVLEFRAPVPSTDFARVKVGAPVQVTVDALPGFTTHGKVVRVAPLVEERTRSFEAVVEVPGGGPLVGGLFARAAVRTGQVAGALVVPPAALVRGGGQPDQAEVFLVAGGKAERRAVTLGAESATGVQILSGLAAGDQVVLDPPAALGAGSPVEIAGAR